MQNWPFAGKDRLPPGDRAVIVSDKSVTRLTRAPWGLIAT